MNQATELYGRGCSAKVCELGGGTWGVSRRDYNIMADVRNAWLYQRTVVRCGKRRNKVLTVATREAEKQTSVVGSGGGCVRRESGVKG